MTRLLLTLRIYCVFAILLGLIYPLSLVAISGIVFPHQANGSLIDFRGVKVGSSLIAQEFTLPNYFHSRFSAVEYDARNSGESGLAVSGEKLYKQIEKNIKEVRLENDFEKDVLLPADMVLYSASGLDPHISIANAMMQLPRVARHRHLSKEVIRRLIFDYLESCCMDAWGQAGVNVLRLNLALDSIDVVRA